MRVIAGPSTDVDLGLLTGGNHLYGIAGNQRRPNVGRLTNGKSEPKHIAVLFGPLRSQKKFGLFRFEASGDGGILSVVIAHIQLPNYRFLQS